MLGVKPQLIGHMNRNCLLKHVTEVKTEGRIEVMGRGGRRKQILDTEERKGYWKLKSTKSHCVELCETLS